MQPGFQAPKIQSHDRGGMWLSELWNWVISFFLEVHCNFDWSLKDRLLSKGSLYENVQIYIILLKYIKLTWTYSSSQQSIAHWPQTFAKPSLPILPCYCLSAHSNYLPIYYFSYGTNYLKPALSCTDLYVPFYTPLVLWHNY